MKVIVNRDDALSAYLAMESGNPYVTYGISEKVVDDKDSHEIEKDVSVRNAEHGENIISITTATWRLCMYRL